jgi:hypothetical protein
MPGSPERGGERPLPGRDPHKRVTDLDARIEELDAMTEILLNLSFLFERRPLTAGAVFMMRWR